MRKGLPMPKKGKKVAVIPDAKPVPGFQGRYVVSFEGTVYRCWKTGFSAMTPALKRGNPIVRLERPDGTRQEMLLARIVQLAWIGPTPRGKVCYHKNGIKTDNLAGNIGFISAVELGRRTGGQSRRRPVLKIEPREGEIVAAYPSARKAAAANFMSYQTVMDCCNRKTKRGICPDGFRYSWQADDWEEGGST